MIDLARDQLGVQLGFLDALDAKLGLFLSVASGLIAILMGVVTVQTQPLGVWSIRGVTLSIGVYLLTAGSCIVGLWLRPWKVEIDAAKVYRDHFTLSLHDVGWELANTYTSHYRKNRPRYRLKVRALRWASAGLVAQTLSLIVTLALVLNRA